MDGTVWTRRLHEKTLERRVHPFIHSLRNRCITKLRRSIMNSIMPAANRKIETADGWLLRALNSTGWYAVAGGAQRVDDGVLDSSERRAAGRHFLPRRSSLYDFLLHFSALRLVPLLLCLLRAESVKRKE